MDKRRVGINIIRLSKCFYVQDILNRNSNETQFKHEVPTAHEHKKHLRAIQAAVRMDHLVHTGHKGASAGPALPHEYEHAPRPQLDLMRFAADKGGALQVKTRIHGRGVITARRNDGVFFVALQSTNEVCEGGAGAGSSTNEGGVVAGGSSNTAAAAMAYLQPEEIDRGQLPHLLNISALGGGGAVITPSGLVAGRAEGRILLMGLRETEGVEEGVEQQRLRSHGHFQMYDDVSNVAALEDIFFFAHLANCNTGICSLVIDADEDSCRPGVRSRARARSNVISLDQWRGDPEQAQLSGRRRAGGAAQQLGDKDVVALSAVLQHCTHLTHLDLSHNAWGDLSAEYLCQVLERLSALTAINVSENPALGNMGKMQLGTSILDNRTMQLQQLCCDEFEVGHHTREVALGPGLLPCISGEDADGVNFSCCRNQSCSSGTLVLLAAALRNQRSVSVLRIHDGDVGGKWTESGIGWAYNTARTGCVGGSRLRAQALGFEASTTVARALARCMKGNRTISFLQLSNSRLNAQDALEICTALATNSCLQELDLADNALGERGAEHVSDLLLSTKQSIRRLRLCGNGIGCEGAHFMADALTHNKETSVVWLDLANNNIRAPGAGHLADMLPHNDTLVELLLANNMLEYPGVVAIAAGVTKNQRLQSLHVEGNFAAPESCAASLLRISDNQEAIRKVDFHLDGLLQ
jgi:Ran GTPase-activating protein (RanGAP) involved in mRNA processing and transport